MSTSASADIDKIIYSEELSPEISRRAKYLFEVLRCPTCQNIPIKDSYSALSEIMKKIIISKLKEGWTDEQIINYFVQRYGADVLLNPGRGLFSYLPFGVLGAGILVLIILIVKRK